MLVGLLTSTNVLIQLAKARIPGLSAIANALR
jgi:hypothetical protein